MAIFLYGEIELKNGFPPQKHAQTDFYRLITAISTEIFKSEKHHFPFFSVFYSGKKNNLSSEIMSVDYIIDDGMAQFPRPFPTSEKRRNTMCISFLFHIIYIGTAEEI